MITLLPEKFMEILKAGCVRESVRECLPKCTWSVWRLFCALTDLPTFFPRMP